ncbi:uncharacterized protein LOC142343708 isoform X2 [Convolutriloba macropyga]|uniref:uncharacterized protein LOC142343708 isoform X2 n=1 Tax=Convolutriloba macropyga TaxID=536237 RepID=UPI003F51BDFA
MGWIINERLMPILGQINERIQNNFRTDYGKNVSDRLMCSPLERALDTLSSPKSSLVLKKDAASRVTDILNHYPENSEQILKQLTLNLLESRDNNSRICSASVLKQFSVKVVDMVPLKWDYLEIEVCDAGSSILIGDRLGVLSFVATFEQLQSRMIQLSEKSEDAVPRGVTQLMHLGTEAEYSGLYSEISTKLFTDSELFTQTRDVEIKKSSKNKNSIKEIVCRKNTEVEANQKIAEPKKSVSWSKFKVAIKSEFKSDLDAKLAPLDDALIRMASQFLNGICSSNWESRHGSALGLACMFTPMIKRWPMPSENAKIVADHLLKVFLLDNFCDFVSEETSFPVRETLAELISEFALLDDNFLRSIILQVVAVLNQSSWNLRINGYLLLNSMVDRWVVNKNEKEFESTFTSEEFNRLCKLCLNKFDADPDIARLRNQFIINIFDLLSEDLKTEVSTFILQTVKQSYNDGESVVNNFNPVSDSNLNLLHKINDNCNSMTMTSSCSQIVKQCCWQRIFTKILLFDESSASSDVLRCIKTLNTVFDESCFISDCYLYALLCFSLNDDSIKIFEEIQRNIALILISIKSCEANLSARIGALCTQLLNLLLLQPTSIIEIDESFCKFSWTDIKIEVPKICANFENVVHENVIQIIAGLITCQPDFEQIIDNFVVLSNCQSYLNFKIGLEALLCYGSATAGNSRNYKFQSHILDKVNQIVGFKNWIFQESLEKFALIKKLAEKLPGQVVCKTKDMTIQEIQDYVISYNSSNNGEESEIVERVLSEIDLFHQLSQKYRISLQLLSAAVLVKYSSLPEKLSPIINSLLTGLKSSTNLISCSLAAQSLIAICVTGKMSEKAIKVLCRNITDFISDQFLKDLPHKLNCSDHESEYGSNQNIMAAQNITTFFKAKEKSSIKYCVQILLSTPVKKTAQEFLFESIEKQKNSMEMGTCVCFCFLFRFCNSSLDVNFVSTVLDSLITQFTDGTNKNLTQNMILKSCVVANAILNAKLFHQTCEFLFEKLLIDEVSDQNKKTFAMYVILMIALRVNDSDDNRHLRAMKPILTAFATPSLPNCVKADLRPYQKDGVSWLQFLRNYNLNGILADDLGLGKTLMCICILAEQMCTYIKSKKWSSPKRSLVVCPKSLIHHWVQEIKTFCPSLNVKCVEKRREFVELDNFCPYVVIITSYSIVRSECDVISKQEYDYIILDEGHVIKNRLCKMFQSVMQLKGEHRLVLTGTPIQNSVCELWTLFEFLVPSYLGSIEQFKSCFANKLNTSTSVQNLSNKSLERSSKALKQLHAKVLPLILRREKESVLKELPPKTIQDIVCVMSDDQQQLYYRTESKYKQACSEKTSSFKLIKVLLQICNNPELLGSQYKFKSGKIEAFTELISNIFTEDAVNTHRLVVFFQTKAMLKVVSQLLMDSFQNLTFLSLEGSMSSIERMKVVNQFNSDPTFDLLLSTTAVGGVGLNLTGADTVVFVEHDFNPVKDLQAMDRTHRIGQTKPVVVYRLITKNSIEERIMNIQKFKTAVANSVINEENSSTSSMLTSNLADAFVDDNEVEKLAPKKRKKDDKESLLEELEHLWEPLSKISDII